MSISLWQTAFGERADGSGRPPHVFRQLSPPDFDSELQRRLYAPPPELLSTFWTDVVDLRFTLSGHLHQITLGTHLDPTAAEQGTQLILRPEFSNQRTHSKWR